MDSDDQVSHYLVPSGLRLRLNVWLRTQGFSLEPVSSEEGGDSPPTYLLTRSSTTPVGDADVAVHEASQMLYVSHAAVRHWMETGRIKYWERRRIPVTEVERRQNHGYGGP